jgi:hypothetical protein
MKNIKINREFNRYWIKIIFENIYIWGLDLPYRLDLSFENFLEWTTKENIYLYFFNDEIIWYNFSNKIETTILKDIENQLKTLIYNAT